MELPQPPISADIDLRTFDCMPLDVVRLSNSEIIVEADGESFKAAVLLWARSWHQVPAGSLPDNERHLAHMAGLGTDIRRWRKVANVALRGWVKCSDGRLYHPVICEKALDSWRLKRRGQINSETRWKIDKTLKNNNSVDTSAYATGDAKPHAKSMLRAEQSRVDSSETQIADRPSPTTDTQSAESIGHTEKNQPKALKSKPGPLPSDWQVLGKDWTYATDRGWTDDRIRDEAANFVEHFTNGRGRNERRENWSLSWKTWVRKGDAFRPAGASNGAQRPNGHNGRAGAILAGYRLASGRGRLGPEDLPSSGWVHETVSGVEARRSDAAEVRSKPSAIVFDDVTESDG